jgi:hypothetical protein
MKKLFLLIALLILANCDIKPRTVSAAESDESDDYKRVVAKTQWCTLYAIEDGHHTVYWSICTGSNDNSAVDAY